MCEVTADGEAGTREMVAGSELNSLVSKTICVDLLYDELRSAGLDSGTRLRERAIRRQTRHDLQGTASSGSGEGTSCPLSARWLILWW